MMIPPDFEPNFIQSKPVEQTGGNILRRNVPVTMRDGTRLAIDLYFPRQPGRYPVLLERTPYGKHQSVNP
jgi:predicted acyl esterase